MHFIQLQELRETCFYHYSTHDACMQLKRKPMTNSTKHVAAEVGPHSKYLAGILTVLLGLFVVGPVSSGGLVMWVVSTPPP